MPARLAVHTSQVVALALSTLAVSAPRAAPALDQVVQRLTAYALRYGPQLSAIVAEEDYSQVVENEPGTVSLRGVGVTRRVIRSDFVVTLLGDGQTWVAFRDAFEVDGSTLRDRDDRLVNLLSTGNYDNWQRAAALANESARFNIGTQLITRNINVPTLVLQLVNGKNRERFKFSAPAKARGSGRTEDLPSGQGEGGARLEIEYRERDRPTLVRQRNGGDQPLRGTISVDPETGEVWHTHLTWERGPGGAIDVTFGRISGIDVLVPLRMIEWYRSGATTISGEATYSNFRRFQTAVRVVSP